MSRKLFSQILADVENADIADRPSILKEHETPILRQLLLAAFDPTVIFDVEIPQYRTNSETDGYASNNLNVEAKRLYIFMDTYTAVSAKRKTALLAQVLESIDVSDAVALIDVINKDLQKYGLDETIVNKAFPGLIK